MSKEKKLASLKDTLMDAKNLKTFFIAVGVGIFVFSVASGALIGYIIDSMAKPLMIATCIGAIGATYAATEVNKIDSKIETINNSIKAVSLENDYDEEIKEESTNDFAKENTERMTEAMQKEVEFEHKFSYKHDANETHEYTQVETGNKRR